MVLFVTGKKRQMRRRRARSAFSSLTATPKPKKSLDEKFPYLYGGRFFYYYIDQVESVYETFTFTVATAGAHAAKSFS